MRHVHERFHVGGQGPPQSGTEGHGSGGDGGCTGEGELPGFLPGVGQVPMRPGFRRIGPDCWTVRGRTGVTGVHPGQGAAEPGLGHFPRSNCTAPKGCSGHASDASLAA